MTKFPYRPVCPKCGMNMIASTPPVKEKQTFECLRCGHKEARKVDE